MACCLGFYAPEPFAFAATAIAAPPLPSCDGEAVDPWVAELRDRVRSVDGLARYAIARFGEPTACHGRVESVFDGMKFGALELRFTDDVVLLVETFPPEASRVTLLAPHGFEDEDEARARLADYAEHIGVEIDWARPETKTAGAHTVLVFRDEDSGLNASAELGFADGKLTRLRFGLAL